MPAIEICDLKQRALYWEWLGKNNRNEPQVAAPREIPIRWLEGVSITTAPTGGTSPAMDTAVMAEEPVLGSLLWLSPDPRPGKALAAYNAEVASTTSKPFIVQINKSSITPDIKNRNNRYELGLNYFKGAVP